MELLLKIGKDKRRPYSYMQLFCTRAGFFIPSVQVGWALMHPISKNQNFKYVCSGQSDGLIESGVCTSSKELKTESLVITGLKLTAIHRKGVGLSLSLNANWGNLYQIYSGDLRLECTW